MRATLAAILIIEPYAGRWVSDLRRSVGIGLRRGFGLRVLDACPSEDIRQAVVPFSAGVLEERPLHPLHRYFRTPRSRPRGGIVDGELVANRVGIGTGEPLGHVQVLCRSTEADLVRVISRVDDQGIPLPTTA